MAPLYQDEEAYQRASLGTECARCGRSRGEHNAYVPHGHISGHSDFRCEGFAFDPTAPNKLAWDRVSEDEVCARCHHRAGRHRGAYPGDCLEDECDCSGFRDCAPGMPAQPEREEPKLWVLSVWLGDSYSVRPTPLVAPKKELAKLIRSLQMVGGAPMEPRSGHFARPGELPEVKFRIKERGNVEKVREWIKANQPWSPTREPPPKVYDYTKDYLAGISCPSCGSTCREPALWGNASQGWWWCRGCCSAYGPPAYEDDEHQVPNPSIDPKAYDLRH